MSKGTLRARKGHEYYFVKDGILRSQFTAKGNRKTSEAVMEVKGIPDCDRLSPKGVKAIEEHFCTRDEQY